MAKRLAAPMAAVDSERLFKAAVLTDMLGTYLNAHPDPTNLPPIVSMIAEQLEPFYLERLRSER